MVWHPDMDVRCGGVRTAQLAGGVQGTGVLYEGSDVRTVNGFVLPRSRSWLFGIRIAKISPKKKLGDYNCLITGYRDIKEQPLLCP